MRHPFAIRLNISTIRDGIEGGKVLCDYEELRINVGRCIHDEWLHIARSPHPPRGAFSDLGDDFPGGAIE